MARYLLGLVSVCCLSLLSMGATADELDCKGCIDKRDIGRRQVTAGKLSSNAVNSGKVKNDSLTGVDIKDGTLGGTDLADDSVSGAKIADGAISAAKLGVARTIYIEDGVSAAANCTALTDALSGLVGPAAVVLGPGAYDCESNPVVLPASVSLIGSGENLTTITGSVEGSNAGLVRLTDDTALRGLTVQNVLSEGAGGSVAAVVIGAGRVDARNWRISNVTAEAKNGQSATGITVPLLVSCGDSEMTNVTAMASGGDSFNTGITVACFDGSVTASNLTAMSSGSSAQGLAKNGMSTLTVRNSSLVGATESVFRLSGTLMLAAALKRG